MPVADINSRDRLLIVGSFLRKDHPLLAHRVRQAVKSGAQVSIIHSSDDDLLMPVANKCIVAPNELVNALAQVLKALIEERGATPTQFSIPDPQSLKGIEVWGAYPPPPPPPTPTPKAPRGGAGRPPPSPGVWPVASAPRCCSATSRSNIRRRRSLPHWQNESPHCPGQALVSSARRRT